MGTKAETIRVSARPSGFTPWAAAVSALAVAALFMSGLALTVAARDRAVTGVAADGIHEATSTQASTWYPAKLDAMEGRMLAETVRTDGYAGTWYPAKLDAMEGRMLAESVRTDGYAGTWYPAKLDAMEGRMLAERIRIDGQAMEDGGLAG